VSKKHFIALADALRAQRPAYHWDANKRVQWDLDVKAIADVCAASNPAFNRSRWRDYVNVLCGPIGGSQRAKCEPTAM